MADCVSLPNAAEIEELQSYLTLYAISPDATFHAPKYAEAMEKAADTIKQLLAENERIKAERDAAVADIEKYCRYCIVCKNADFTDGYRHNKCHKCLDEDNRYFEWCGIKEKEE